MKKTMQLVTDVHIATGSVLLPAVGSRRRMGRRNGFSFSVRLWPHVLRRPQRTSSAGAGGSENVRSSNERSSSCHSRLLLRRHLVTTIAIRLTCS